MHTYRHFAWQSNEGEQISSQSFCKFVELSVLRISPLHTCVWVAWHGCFRIQKSEVNGNRIWKSEVNETEMPSSDSVLSPLAETLMYQPD